MVKKIYSLLVILIFMCFSTFEVWGEAGEESEFNAQIKTGFHISDYNGYGGKVGEYEVFNHGCEPDVEFNLTNEGENFNFNLGGLYYEHNDQKYHLNADYRRIFIEDFSYNRFQHWLDHDSLKNLSAVGGGPKVSHEDLEMGRDYIIHRSETKSNTVLNLPFFPGAQINFIYRQEVRRGHQQALAISHCAGCHVVARGRRVNEETEDFKTGTSMKFGWLTVVYSYFHRNFNEHGAAPVNNYDEAIHPGTGADVFDDRVQYQNGNLPYNLVPDSQKDSHLVKVQAKLPKNTNFFGSYINTEVENCHNKSELSLDTLTAKFNNRLLPGLNLNLKFRYMNLDNDDIYIDVNEPLATGGPNAGFPWHDHNPALTYNSFAPDFTRKSAMSRELTTVGFNARYLLTQKTFLRLGYEWEEVDRDDYVVGGGGDTKTEENTIKLAMKSWLHRKLKASIAYKWQNINHPFNNLKAACEVVDPASTYGNPWTGLQYWERQESRTATLSNQPSDVNEIKTVLTWSIKPNLSLIANYRWIDKENDEIDYSHWKQESHMPSLNLWYAPAGKLSFNFSYVYDQTQTNTPTCIPVFDG